MSSRNGSSTSSSTEGSAWSWILEHFLTYPGTFEIPLRTMFAINLTPTLLSGSSPESSPSTPSSPSSPREGQHRWGQDAADHFRDCLLTHLSQLPTRQVSLPASFISSYVRRCFPPELCDVDFTMALTALDYLKDLETKRRRELTLVFARLGLDNDTLGEAELEISRAHVKWAVGMQAKDGKVEALYTEVYVGLRRWILINQMTHVPFSKASTIAMLNTLYPPAIALAPTRQLTTAILTTQRSAFFRYIQAVEKNGNAVLRSLEHQGQRTADEKTGWPAVRESIDSYLRAANSVIDECVQIPGPEYFSPASEQARRDDRADSGVSFRSANRPSTRGSGSSRPSTGGSITIERKPSNLCSDKSLPPAPPIPSLPSLPTGLQSRDANTLGPPRKKTALEKMMRGIFLRRDNKVLPSNENSEKTREVKKMKSSGALRSNLASSAKVSYEITEEKRQRLIYEAQREKDKQSPIIRKMPSTNSIDDLKAKEAPEAESQEEVAARGQNSPSKMKSPSPIGKSKVSEAQKETTSENRFAIPRKSVRKMQSTNTVGLRSRSVSPLVDEPFQLSEQRRNRIISESKRDPSIRRGQAL